MALAFPDFAPGDYTFYVQAIDAEDNIDPTPATYSWTATPDVGGPATTILTGPFSPTIALDAAFTFAATDNATPVELLTFECALDGAAYEPCQSPHEIQVEPGLHTLSVRAVDLALNAGTPATFTWQVVGAPETTIVSGPPATTGDTTATFSFAADQAGATFQCSLNGGAFVDCATPFTLTGLGGGSYVLEVQAINIYGLVDETPAQYAWTVTAGPDLTPPDTTILTSPANPSTGSTATFTFSASELGASFECQLDGAGFTGCDTPHTVQDLLGGDHTFEVRAIDQAGNVDPTPASYSWTVTGPPVTAVLSGPDPVTESTGATFTFSSSVPGSTFECSLDGAAAVACSSPWSYSDLDPGVHVFLVYATAPGGFVDADGPEYEWEIVPLDTLFTGGPPATTTSTEAIFSFSSPVPGATFECSVDGDPFELCSSPVELTGLLAGTHSFAVRAISPVNGPDPTPAFFAWTVQGLPPPDTTPPNTTITSGPAATTTSTTAVFTFGASELGASFACSLDGGPSEACSSPVTLNDLPLGPHSFVVEATDPAGNVDPTPATATWEVVADSTPPETTITAGPSGQNGALDVSFEFAGSDDTTLAVDLSFECALDGAAFEPCDSPHSIQGLELGAHSFAVRAVDELGNVDPTPASRSWTTVDLIAPDTAIDSGPADPTELTTATFTFSADEPGATFECSLDGADYAPCASPHTVTGAAVGLRTFQARAVDAAGNADPTPAVYQWTVVAPTPPNTTISAGPPATTTSATATFAFSASEPGVTFECALDGGAFAECESPYELTGLAVGAHTLQVRAVDAAGNADPTPASFSWTVEAPPPADTTPPQTTIASGPPASSTVTTAGFSFTASESGSSFECALDGAAFAPCVSPVTLTELAVGSHTFAVRATDAAGNTDPTPASYSWTVQVPAGCSATSLTYQANADAWVEQNSAANNNGTDSILKVQGKSGGDNFRALVRFALPASLPSGCQVESATLRLYASSAASGRTLQALRLGGSWSEGGVTWANQPATVGAAATTASGSGYRQWNVTSQVQAIFTAGSNNGFLIRDAVEGSGSAEQQLHSREHGEFRPELVVTYASGSPPPADTTPPQTTITASPAATTTSTGASFSFSADEAGSSFECSLDGAAFTPCTSPQAYSGLAVGAHSFAVRATDGAGNVDATPASASWTIEGAASCTAATLTLTASADSWIEQKSPSNNNGADSTLKVQGKGGGDNFRALVRFDLPASIPAGCQIQSATLRLFAKSFTNGRTLQAFRLGGSWTEGGVTWANQPATAGSAATVSSGSGNRNWNVTSQVQAGYAAGAHNGFLIRDANEGGGGSEQQFFGRENSTDRPTLIITYGPASP